MKKGTKYQLHRFVSQLPSQISEEIIFRGHEFTISPVDTKNHGPREAGIRRTEAFGRRCTFLRSSAASTNNSPIMVPKRAGPSERADDDSALPCEKLPTDLPQNRLETQVRVNAPRGQQQRRREGERRRRRRATARRACPKVGDRWPAGAVPRRAACPYRAGFASRCRENDLPAPRRIRGRTNHVIHRSGQPCRLIRSPPVTPHSRRVPAGTDGRTPRMRGLACPEPPRDRARKREATRITETGGCQTVAE